MTIIYLVLINTIIYIEKLNIYLDYIISVHIYSHRQSGGRAGVKMQHVDIKNIFDFRLLEIEQ